MKRLYLLFLLIPFFYLGHFRSSDYRSGRTVPGDWIFSGSVDVDSVDTDHLVVNDNEIFVGDTSFTGAGWNVGGSVTTGIYNTGFGFRALESLTEGNSNTGFGYAALRKVTTGENNTGFGTDALKVLLTGSYNTVVGADAGKKVYSGTHNTFIGAEVGNVDSAGSYNTYVGAYSGAANEGNENTLLGYYSGYTSTTAESNTAVGLKSLYLNQTGNSNVVLGFHAGYNETGSNKLYIANDSTSNPLIYGDFDSSFVKINHTIRMASDSTPSIFTALKTSGAEDVVDSCDFRIGLSKTHRRVIICDLDQIDTDYGLGTELNPSLYIYRAAHTSHSMQLYYNGISAQAGWTMSVWGGGITWQIKTDMSSGNPYIFSSGSNIELTASSGTQAWIFGDAQINQSGTAGFTGYLFNVDTIATGSGVGLLGDFQLGDVSKYSIDLDGVAVSGTQGIGTFNYIDADIDDTEEYILTKADGKAGWGMASMDVEWTYFRFTAAGVVTLVNETANVGTTDGTDAKFNIFDSGTTITFENQLGDNKELNINVWYVN